MGVNAACSTSVMKLSYFISKLFGLTRNEYLLYTFNFYSFNSNYIVTLYMSFIVSLLRYDSELCAVLSMQSRVCLCSLSYDARVCILCTAKARRWILLSTCLGAAWRHKWPSCVFYPSSQLDRYLQPKRVKYVSCFDERAYHCKHETGGSLLSSNFLLMTTWRWTLVKSALACSIMPRRAIVWGGAGLWYFWRSYSGPRRRQHPTRWD